MIENTGARASDLKYTKDVIDNIRKVVGDVFAAEIAEANKEFVKASREQGVSMKQVTKDSFQVYMDSKKELDAILQNQEQLIELYEKNEEIRNKVNEITPDKPLPDIKNEEILKSIEERVNFMNELLELADHYVNTYSTKGGQQISMIKGKESLDKMIITRDLLADNDEFENEKFDSAKDLLAKLINELKVFKELSLKDDVKPEVINDIKDSVAEPTPTPTPTPVLDENPIENLIDEEEKAKKRKRGKRKKDEPKADEEDPSLFKKFVASFLDWIEFDKKRNWVLELFRLKKNEEKQDKLKPGIFDKASDKIATSVENFNNSIFDDILNVPDVIMGIIMGAKSSIVNFISGLLGTGLRFILPTVLKGAFVSGIVSLAMTDEVKKFAVDFIKRFFGENIFTNALIGSINDNTLQIALGGAGLGFMLGGPVGAIVGFIVGGVGNYVYKHWDEILKTFDTYVTKEFTTEGLLEKYNSAKKDVDDISKKIEDSQAKQKRLSDELYTAYMNKDKTRIESLTQELLNVESETKLHQEELNRKIDEMNRYELRAKLSERGSVLDQVWLFMDWITVGFLAQWTLSIQNFREYVNREFSVEKISAYIYEKTMEMLNFFRDLPGMLMDKTVTAARELLFGKEEKISPEELKKNNISERDYQFIKEFTKREEGLGLADVSEEIRRTNRTQFNPMVSLLEAKKYEEDLGKFSGNKGATNIAPQTTTITNVNNASTSISNRASPFDPKRFMWSTGGGF